MRNEPEAGYLSEVFVSFQGEGSWVGRRQLFIRLAGCRQRCAYCDTSPSQAARPKDWLLRGAKRDCRVANPVAVPALLPRLERLLKELGPIHSVALTGGEPTEQPEFLGRLLPGLKKSIKKTPILLETNGLENILKIRRFDLVDFVSLDIKLPSATGHWLQSFCVNPKAATRGKNLKNAFYKEREPGNKDREALHFSQYRQILHLFPRKKGCIKIVFGTKSTPSEIKQAAALAWKYKPGWDLFLQPATGVSWGKSRLAVKLEGLSRAALAVHPQTRLLPQIHPVLGIK